MTEKENERMKKDKMVFQMINTLLRRLHQWYFCHFANLNTWHDEILNETITRLTNFSTQQ